MMTSPDLKHATTDALSPSQLRILAADASRGFALPRYTPSNEVVQCYKRLHAQEQRGRSAGWVDFLETAMPASADIQLLINAAVREACQTMLETHGNGYELSLSREQEQLLGNALEKRLGLEAPENRAQLRQQIMSELMANLAHNVAYRFSKTEVKAVNKHIAIWSLQEPEYRPDWLQRLTANSGT